MQVPSPLPAVIESSEPEGEGTSEWMMALEEELLNLDEELAMVAKMAKSKALEPTSFTNADQHLDQLDWKKVMEEGMRHCKRWVLGSSSSLHPVSTS